MPWEPDLSKPADITSRWFHDYVFDFPARALRVTMDTPFATDSLYEAGEAVDPGVGGYKGLVVGGYTEGTEVFTSLVFSDTGRLKVDAEITIQSVDVEVNLDATSGDSVIIYGHPSGNSGNPPVPFNVTNDGTLRVVTSFAGVETNLYNEESVPAGIETTVITYTIPVATDFHVLQIDASGEAEATFILRKNGNKACVKRNSWANRNVVFDYPYGFKQQAGDVISLHVIHNNDNNCMFEASIYGEADT